MNDSIDDIVMRLKTITGDSIIAWSVNYTISNNEMNKELLQMMILQIKDQINDNPEMMKQVLTPENYTFFSDITF